MESWEEFLPGAWCVPDLLTEDECQELIQMAQATGIESKPFTGDTRHRQRTRVRLDAPGISQRLWERVRDQIPQEIVVPEDGSTGVSGLLNAPDSLHEFVGKWTPVGVAPKMNVAYCSGKGHLAAHRDADMVLGDHERSFLTINGFLNERPKNSGGATRFLIDDIRVEGSDIRIRDSDVLHKVEATKSGRGVVFFHGLMHDGEPLAEGSPPKWIFRSLVLYRRDPASAPKLTEAEDQARQLVREAEQAEASGRFERAMECYTKAYRLDPKLEFA